MDGSNRRLLLQSNNIRPFGLVLANKNLYWTDWTTNGIHRLSLLNPSSNVLLRRTTSVVFGIAFVNETARQGMFFSFI